MLRLTRVRFSVRRMMVAVAVVAALLTGGIQAMKMSQLTEVHRRKAAEYARYAESFRTNVPVFERLEIYWSERSDDPRSPVKIKWCGVYARYNRRCSSYYERLKEKYEYLASHPWLAASPDPPLLPDPNDPLIFKESVYPAP